MVDKAIDGVVTDHHATVIQRQCDPMFDADGVRQAVARAPKQSANCSQAQSCALYLPIAKSV